MIIITTTITIITRYEIAKGEFEIATESTEGSTIYAASDREIAKEALEQLIWVYSLYSGASIEELISSPKGIENQGQSEDQTRPNIEYAFEPESITPQVKEEVKTRVGQRVRELVRAVKSLEEKARNSD